MPVLPQDENATWKATNTAVKIQGKSLKVLDSIPKITFQARFPKEQEHWDHIVVQGHYFEVDDGQTRENNLFIFIKHN